ncbi:class I SAM-dependent methyltransferase [Halalkalibacterium ligniniphilum]|uniref:class I SAM-dependent methyltransferase n=1 Tax=Halalkalibacterium ligniniphilum TaxID=1134413 RepID=UPI000344D934|nr:class I SAM-dependent methyltransferase [Halalkalibacterium ligniniphilum]
MEVSNTLLGCDYIDLWKKNMKEWDGTLSKRMIYDEAEEHFWNSFIEKKKQKGEDYINLYAYRVQEELLTLVHSKDSVLEIGPGWGNYTFFMAKNVNHLTCVDSSQSVINFLKEKTEKYHYKNISFIHGKWEQLNMKQRYDVVFGINCYYRINDIGEALLKMNNAASRLAIVGMTSGPEKPHYIDLHRERGYSIRFRRTDYIHLQNILYQLGIMANCKIINIPSVTAYPSYDALIQDNITKIMTKGYNKGEVEQALSRYVIEKDGKYEYPYTFNAVLLYWKPIYDRFRPDK